MKKMTTLAAAFAVAALAASAPAILAQSDAAAKDENTERETNTIRVDITPGHQTNSFAPDRALGAGIDRLPNGATDKLYTDAMVKQILSAGWMPVSYRQNTELHVEAWHWNPEGTWSDPSGKGYFTGNAAPGELIRHSYGYPLPHRGVTRNDGTETEGYSRLTDGDLDSYWKSNPYLTKAFTGEEDSLHPQWVMLDLATPQSVEAIRIAWADPYARRYLVQYWTGLSDPIKFPTKGVWQTFPSGVISEGRGGKATIRLRMRRAGAVRADLDDGVVANVRFAWSPRRRLAQLRRLRDSRDLSGDDRARRRISRCDTARERIKSRRRRFALPSIRGIRLRI